MIDTGGLRGRLIKSALELGAEKPWQDVTLLEIAGKAQCSLADLKGVFRSKSDILTGFVDEIDEIVLRNPPEQGQGQSHRDTIFEVVMARFDALEPYKPALKSIHGSGALDAGLIRRMIESQRWMLNVAGVGTDGVRGTVRTIGLGAVYAGVFRIWLADEDPGMARTMAGLDQRLRGGERALEVLDEVHHVLGRLAGLACRRDGVGAKAPGDEPPAAVEPAAPLASQG